MTTFISFIGTNDAGKLSQNDDGAVLTILKGRKFDKIILLYNAGGIIKNLNIAYKDIAEYLKKEIIERNYCKPEKISINELIFEDVADHSSVYPVLLDYLQKTFPNATEEQIYAGISSGTPAMQTSWILFAETDIFPLQLIRSVEKRHAKNNKRVFDVELLTGAKLKLEKLKNIEKIIKPKGEYNPFVITNNTELDSKQQDIVRSSFPILITGETGTGKEILYKTILEICDIPEDKHIELNCGAFSENLIGSELFGHIKGAFTGAYDDKKGIVEIYKDGVIFLDEINSLPISVQVKLLRFLDSGEYRKIGDTISHESKARIIAAANQSISQMVAEGSFREDLYYRLRTIELQIPPLRKNPKRIEQLIDLLSEVALPKQVKELLLNNNYKGNVREMKIILERLKLLNKKSISVNDVKQILSEFQTQQKYSEIEIPKDLEGKAFKLLRKILTNAALKQTNGNTLAAAKILGVTHPSIKKWALEKE